MTMIAPPARKWAKTSWATTADYDPGFRPHQIPPFVKRGLARWLKGTDRRITQKAALFRLRNSPYYDILDHYGKLSSGSLLCQPYGFSLARLEEFSRGINAVALVVRKGGPWNAQADFIEIREAGDDDKPGVIFLDELPQPPRQKPKTTRKPKNRAGKAAKPTKTAKPSKTAKTTAKRRKTVK